MRLDPRSTWAMAVVIESSANTRPRPRASSPASLLLPGPSTATASPPSCPGETFWIVAATTRAGCSWSRFAARPVSASRNGTTASDAWRARARLLVNPSPYRNRTNAPAPIRQRPNRRTSRQASSGSSSSPSISVVTGTIRAVGMGNLIGHVTSLLTSLPAPLALTIIGALVFAEAALFVGFVLPGETAVLFGGALASAGHLSFPALLAVVIVAAIVGDS